MGKSITQEDLDGPSREVEKQLYKQDLIKHYGTLSVKDNMLFNTYFDHVEKFIPSELQPHKIMYKAFFKNPATDQFMPLIYVSNNAAIKAIYSGLLDLRFKN